ncbi:MAG: hypothetical protein IT331_01910 [Anaerolineae bacterium]|nr:hypothetical protein [Anaerolineae bacterium]
MGNLKLENKFQPLASFVEFRSRVLRYLMLAFAFTLLWLLVGGVGFHFIAELSWADALYNSAMMVSAMGPVYNFTTTPSKIFASFYALTSGLVFIGIVGLAFTPIIHRFFHIFHLEEDGRDE